MNADILQLFQTGLLPLAQITKLINSLSLLLHLRQMRRQALHFFDDDRPVSSSVAKLAVG
ncbi:hypothetical protein AMK81_23085 [Escherichia coli]|nr:hypothetical protein AMK81_23085 [Escherichia coli]